jgi:hypothetical protein
MKDKKRPATEKDVEAFFEQLSELEVGQFLERILKGKKPPKKLDLLCWHCEHSRLRTCPKTDSKKSPCDGVQKCADWVTSPTIEYGNSPAKRRAQKNLLRE